MKILAILWVLILSSASLSVAQEAPATTPLPRDAPDSPQPLLEKVAPATITKSIGGEASGVKLAEAVSTTTGIAISPLMGVGAVGVWKYYKTPVAARGSLPWYAHPYFWIPALGLVALLALKEPVLYFMPGAKKPLDLLEVMENKASAIMATPIVIDLAIRAFSVENSIGTNNIVTAGWSEYGTVGIILGSLLLLFTFATVWIVSHAVNVLILLSPSATLDMLMRTFRTSILGAVTVSAFLNPWIGLFVAVLVIFIAIRCFGWAWRLGIFGSSLAFDFITRRRENAIDLTSGVRAFLSRSLGGLPSRTIGKLKIGVTGQPVFRGSPLPWLPATELEFPAENLQVARSLTGPVVCENGRGFPVTRLSLPPRFSGQELALGAALGIPASTEHPVKRNWVMAINWLRETISNQSATMLPDQR